MSTDLAWLATHTPIDEIPDDRLRDVIKYLRWDNREMDQQLTSFLEGLTHDD